jgi:hypothetical protein
MQNGIPFWYFHNHGGALEGSAGAQRRSQGRWPPLIPPSA